MAKIVIIDPYVKLGSTVYSTSAKSATINLTRPELSTLAAPAAGGDEGWDTFLGGIKGGTLAIDWLFESDMSGLEVELWDAFNGTTGILAWVVSQDTTTGTTGTAASPRWSGSLLVSNHNVAFAVGALYAGSETYRLSGAVTRAIA